MERPTKGYKAVIRYNEFRWYILELEIPDDATIVHTGSGFYRTDKAVPRHFWPARTKTAIIDTSAHSCTALVHAGEFDLLLLTDIEAEDAAGEDRP